jgi:CxxC-x17-CxxC domain-containing protein
MKQETRNCQNCTQSFVIEPDDFAFYEKMKVPAPTWCPGCRMQRRMVWRNERALYRETCAQCGAATLSVYAPGHLFPVYCHDCWKSDAWDAIAFGRDYDFSRPFFTQFRELLAEVPCQAVFLIDVVSSPYANFAAWGKNLYLSYSTLDSENVFYSKIVGEKSHNVFDSYDANSCENCYEVNQGDRNYHTAFMLNSRDCMDSAFLYNCANCKHCFMSANLRNSENVFRGVKYSKEEYDAKMSGEKLGSFRSLERLKGEFATLRATSLHRFANIVKSVDATGNDLLNAKNVRGAFSGFNLENIKHLFRGFNDKDSQDIIHSQQVERVYEYVSGGARDSTGLLFSMNCSGNSQELIYTAFCSKSSHLFGCIGLRNKQYCILNQQYTKEEYEALVPKIITHMNEMPYVDAKGRVYRYGEFFPSELSPFAYNETIAQEYFPLTKDEALAQGYRWKDPDTKEYKITIKPETLPDHITDVTDDILKETIGCAHAASPAGGCNHQCTTAFKVIPEELKFYQRMNLPLPRLCPNCRHYERLSQRNPLKLWHRTCQCAGTKSDNALYQNTVAHEHHQGDHCPNEFETSYAPNRKEVVYCEQCYNAEVV